MDCGQPGAQSALDTSSHLPWLRHPLERMLRSGVSPGRRQRWAWWLTGRRPASGAAVSGLLIWLGLTLQTTRCFSRDVCCEHIRCPHLLDPAPARPPPPVRGPLARRRPLLVQIVHDPGTGRRVPLDAGLLGTARRRVQLPHRAACLLGHPVLVTVTWLEHASRYATMKWPQVAAHTRAGIADALATITPAVITGGRGQPPASLLRAALYGWAFNPSRADSQPPLQIADALAWARRHSLPLASLTDPQVTRRALDALTVRLDGGRAAAAMTTRKRAVFYNALGYAVELGLLDANPLSRIAWRPPRGCAAVDPRVVANPAQAAAILAEVTRIRPELTAFFACLYYAALRPEEAVALTAECCDLPRSGWGSLTLATAAPRSGTVWTGNGTSHERRGLKLRPTVRSASCPSRRGWSRCCATTSALTRQRPTDGCSRPRVAGCCTKAATAGPGTLHAPLRSASTWPPPHWCAAPTICAIPPCHCGWLLAPRPLRSPPGPGTRCRCCSRFTRTACLAMTRDAAADKSWHRVSAGETCGRCWVRTNVG
jgi:hypothetical protein